MSAKDIPSFLKQDSLGYIEKKREEKQKSSICFLTVYGRDKAYAEKTPYGARVEAFKKFFVDELFDVTTIALPKRKRDIFSTLRRLKRCKADILFLSAPPFSALLFALLVKKK